MSFILQETKTNIIIENKDGVIYFKTKQKAKNYLKNCYISGNYRIVKTLSPKEEYANDKLILYDNQIMDIYHAIEMNNDEEKLLQLAKLLKDVLKQRRKSKKDLNNYSNMVSMYKNRTDILNILSIEDNANDKYRKV